MGRIELAQGGTVFLDEVGELPLRLQARLLDFLQSRSICPVGGSREVKLDVRVIAATHKNLAKMVKQGTFREDLFHRLRVLQISIPSLAERADEFDVLMHSCLEDACLSAGKKILRLAESTAALLESYSWPGNLRELRNVMEYVAWACEGEEALLKICQSGFLRISPAPQLPRALILIAPTPK